VLVSFFAFVTWSARCGIGLELRTCVRMMSQNGVAFLLCRGPPAHWNISRMSPTSTFCLAHFLKCLHFLILRSVGETGPARRPRNMKARAQSFTNVRTCPGMWWGSDFLQVADKATNPLWVLEGYQMWLERPEIISARATGCHPLGPGAGC
jgi:hypothetical protein